MLGVLPFLIQWIALGQLGSQNHYFQHVQQPMSYLPKTHWTLLNEFRQLPEEDIDHFLPQICNMILDREALRDDDLYDYFESVIEQKCAECFSFGTRVCGVLKATQQAPSESLFKSILTSATTQSLRTEERLRALQERVEYATANGFNLPAEHGEMRSAYYRDYQFMLDTLARLGTELKSYPVPLRNVHLRHALSQCNSLLYFRMASRGSVSTSDTPLTDFQAFSDLSAHSIASLLPEAAQYSLHLPLHRTHDLACRILRFVESECEVLPSKERCPYVVVVEVLEQEYRCSSHSVYSQGRVPAMHSVLSVRQGQMLYSGEPLPIENENMYGDASLSSGGNAQMVAQSIDERQYNTHSQGHVNTNGDGYGRPFVPRSATRGKLLSSNLNQYHGAYSGAGSAGDVSGAGGRGSVGGGHSRRARRYRGSARPQLETESAEHSSSRAGDEANSSRDVAEERKQLQEAYSMYDEACSTAQANRQGRPSNNADSGGGGRGKPDIVIKPVESGDGVDGDEDGICILDDSDRPAITRTGPINTVSSEEANSDSNPESDGPPNTQSAASTGSIRGGSTPSNSNNYLPNSAFSRDKLPPRRTNARFHRKSSTSSVLPAHPSSQKYIAGDHLPRIETNTQPFSGRVVEDISHDTTSITHPVRTPLTALKTASPFTPSTSWAERRATLRSNSPFGQLPGWDARAFIVKSGDDLRKEVLAMQVMEFCQKVFEMEGLDIFLRPYQILTTGAQAGLVEFLQGADSIDKIKKSLQNQQPGAASATTVATAPATFTLKEYFERRFGPSYSFFHARAVKNFVKSLVGYSLLTYIVQVKDRHNGNILFDEEGHVLHIDFGFILGDSPGFNINFESAPFKLTAEYVEVLGGLESEDFKLFQDLFLRGFLALQKHVDGLTSIVQLFYGDKRKAAAEGVRSRLLFPQSQADILSLIGDSLDNWRTKQYDWYQERTNNIQL